MKTYQTKLRGLVAILAVMLCSASSLYASESLVVYRSQLERDADQFLYDHPEIILWGCGLLVAAVVIGFAINRMNQRRRW